MSYSYISSHTIKKTSVERYVSTKDRVDAYKIADEISESISRTLHEFDINEIDEKLSGFLQKNRDIELIELYLPSGFRLIEKYRGVKNKLYRIDLSAYSNVYVDGREIGKITVFMNKKKEDIGELENCMVLGLLVFTAFSLASVLVFKLIFGKFVNELYIEMGTLIAICFSIIIIVKEIRKRMDMRDIDISAYLTSSDMNVMILIIAGLVTAGIFTILDASIKEKAKKRNVAIIERLNYAVKFKDNDTANHVERIGRYSTVIARTIGMSKEWCEDLQKASVMHDIGKVGIPDSILKKRDKLTDQEWDVMRKHPEIGAEIIGESKCSVLIMARNVAIAHHEKWDGTGYPYGISKEEIPLSARIVAVADVFDALISDRPYKKAWPIDNAISFINDQSGRHFDPTVVEAFLKSVDLMIGLDERG
ncbi:HD domain-containing protein [Vibrio splendidus]|nr:MULTISPECIES: HD domain-containing phosphohydrolase [Vibrio]MDH5923972.1 HD domain-containing protein [Vibrio splendidus]